MKVAIIGAGIVGSFLAKRLSKEDYDVVVVDVDPSKLEQISLSADVMTLNCDATEANCLKQISDFDLFVVVTENDEKNLTITTLLRSLFKKEKVLFRVKNKSLSSPPVKEFLGAEPVNILSETVQKVFLAVRYPFAKEVIKLEKERLVIFKLPITVESFLAGKQVLELAPLREKFPFTIVAVEREGSLLIPKGDTFLFPGDVVYVAVKEEEAEKIAELLKIPYQPVKLVFVMGYSQFTEELLLRLSELKGLKVKLVLNSKERSQELSGRFQNVDVFFGELTDTELLKEEGIDRADLVVSVSEDEENNILSAVLSKKLGAKKTCALITHPEYEEIIESIGIDLPIAPRKVLASKVYRKLSKRKFFEIVELSEKVDVVETVVDKEVMVKDFKNCGLIIAVNRDGKVHLATGLTKLKPGDKLICVVERK